MRGDLIAVLAFEALETFDPSLNLSSFGLSSFILSSLGFSSFLVDLLYQELRELGLGSCSASSWTLVIRDVDAFLCCEPWEPWLDSSVSGGLGGLPSLVGLPRVAVECSADLALGFSSEPRSVDCGVYGLAGFTLKSSLLLTASLLWALLKLGYGRLPLEVAPGADAVLASSGTRSAMDDDASDLFSESLSFSLRLRCGVLTGSPVSGSMTLGLELRDDLCFRVGSFSFSLLDR